MIAEDGAGTIVKFTGDGAMIAYGEDDATHAINDAIRVQEAIKESVERRQVTVSCSIGIALGEVVEFETAHGPDSARRPTARRGCARSRLAAASSSTRQLRRRRRWTRCGRRSDSRSAARPTNTKVRWSGPTCPAS